MKLSALMFLFISFSLANCGRNNTVLFEYTDIDYNKYYQLEEDEYNFLFGIIEVDANYERILITDIIGKSILVYSLDGRLIKKLWPTLDISDSLALKAVPHRDDIRYATTTEELSYIDKDKWNDHLATLEQYFSNSFGGAVFYNDSMIIISATVGVSYRLLKDPPDRFRGIGTLGAYLLVNTNTWNYEVKLIEYNDLGWGQTRTLGIDYKQNLLISSFSDSRQKEYSGTDSVRRKENLDSLWGLAYFDIEGKFIKPIFQIPGEYLYSKAFISDVLEVSSSDGNTFAAYHILPRVYNVETNEYFEIQGIDKVNYDYLEEAISLQSDKKELKEHFKSVISKTNLFISDITVTKKNTILVYFHYYIDYEKRPDNEMTKPYIQEYTFSGKLIKEMEIEKKNEYGKIEFIGYYEDIESLVIFRKSQKGWFYNYLKWGEK